MLSFTWFTEIELISELATSIAGKNAFPADFVNESELADVSHAVLPIIPEYVPVPYERASVFAGSALATS